MAGDIESQPFLEAIRQVGLEQGRDNCCYIHVVLVPYISGSDEYKSKPAQHSVRTTERGFLFGYCLGVRRNHVQGIGCGPGSLCQ